MVELGWKSVGLLELMALPHTAWDRRTDWVRSANILLVNGGDAAFLAHWTRQPSPAAQLPSLGDKLGMGLSAGSMAGTPRMGEAFVEMKPSITGDDKGLGLVDFSLFPRLDYPGFPEDALPHAGRWAAELGNPSYAIDDQTAIQVADGVVKVFSEGNPQQPIDASHLWPANPFHWRER